MKNSSPPSSLSISIVIYKSSEFQLTKTIKSLVRAIKKAESAIQDFSCMVYLINNEKTNSSNDIINRVISQTLNKNDVSSEHLFGHGNVGYGKGQNLAINKASTNYHLILNPDVTLSENSLIEGMHFLLENSDVIAVSPEVKNAEGKKQFLCKRIPSIYDLFLRGFAPRFIKNLNIARMSHYEMRDVLSKPGKQEVTLISGCFILSRTEELKTIGGFSERYFMYFEDFDLSLRLHEIGKILYLPEMEIVHYGGNSAKKGLSHIVMFMKSGFQFYNTYGWRFI